MPTVNIEHMDTTKKMKIPLAPHTVNDDENASDMDELNHKSITKLTEKEAKYDNEGEEGKHPSLASLSVPSNSKHQALRRKSKDTPSESSVSINRVEQYHNSHGSKNSKVKSYYSGMTMYEIDKGES